MADFSDDSQLALLALCARGGSHPAVIERLRAALGGPFARPGAWAGLAGLAETQGMAPLFAHHLQLAGLAPPVGEGAPASGELHAAAMRHRHAAQVRGAALQEILAAYRAAGIDVVLLKGAGLAYAIYSQPWLRPMRDLDLLVRPGDAVRAQHLLAEIGFAQHGDPRAGLPPDPSYGLPEGHHHLASVSRVTEGLAVSVEIHHAIDCYEPGRRLRTFEELEGTLRPLRVRDAPAFRLGDAEMLWHVYRHAFGDSLTGQRWRLIWAADLVSLVEDGLDRIDWARLRRDYPALWRVLPLLHILTPWSPAAIERLRLPIGRLPAARPAQFDGWPRMTIAQQRPKGLGRTLGDTFFPAPWWLMMHYGKAPSGCLLAGGGRWRAWLAHQRFLWPHLRWAAKMHVSRRWRWLNHDNLNHALLLYLIWQQRRKRGR